MNTFDFVLLGIIVLFTIWGLFRGLFKEVVSTLGIGLSYWAANTYNAQLAPAFQYWMSNPALMHAAAYFALFIGANLGVMIVGWILARAFRLIPPAAVEFLGGALFGSAKGVLVASVVVLCLASFLPKAEFLQNSRVAGYLQPATGWLAQYLPERMRDFDPANLSLKLQEEKENYQKQFMQGPDKKPDTPQGSDMEKVDKMVKDLEKQAGQIQDLLNQGKK